MRNGEMRVLALEIGKTNLRACLVDENTTADLRPVIEPTNRESMTPTRLITRLGHLGHAALDGEVADGVALSFAGAFRSDENSATVGPTVVRFDPRVLDPAQPESRRALIDLRAFSTELAKRFGRGETTMANDCTAALAGELDQRREQSIGNAIFLLISSGTNVAIATDGRVVTDKNGNCAEPQSRLRSHGKPVLSGFDIAKQDGPPPYSSAVRTAWLQRTVPALGRHVLDPLHRHFGWERGSPNHLIIGGAVGLAWFDELRQQLGRPGCAVERATLGDNAGLRGVAAIAAGRVTVSHEANWEHMWQSASLSNNHEIL
jgi:hypothetical protein